MHVQLRRLVGGIGAVALTLGLATVAASPAQAVGFASPDDVSAFAFNDTVEVDWYEPDVAVEPDSYVVSVFAEGANAEVDAPIQSITADENGDYYYYEEFSGLTVGSTYFAAVKAVYGADSSSYATTSPVKIYGKAGAVRLLTAKPASSSATLNWAAPIYNATTGPMLGYTLAITPAPASGMDYTVNNVGYKDVYHPSHSLRLTNLVNGTLYRVTIRAYTGDDNSLAESAAASTVVRPIGLPKVPTRISVAPLSSGRASISWAATQATANPVAGYKVYVNGVLKATVVGYTHKSVTIYGLKKGVRYTYAVRAYNTTGLSGPRYTIITRK